MNPEHPRSLGVLNTEVVMNKILATKIDNCGTNCDEKNHYLLMEIELQQKLRSQLLNLISSYLQLTKPNHPSYCIQGHLFCQIDHRRFNFVKCSDKKMENQLVP